MKKTIKNIVSLVLLSFAVFLLSGCVYWVDPYGNSHPSRGWSGYNRGYSRLQLQQCVDATAPQLEKDFYEVKVGVNRSVWITREQKAQEDCLRYQTQVEQATDEIQRKRIRDIYDFHQQCESFGADVVGRWKAGCPLSPQNKRELWNRGHNAW